MITRASARKFKNSFDFYMLYSYNRFTLAQLHDGAVPRRRPRNTATIKCDRWAVLAPRTKPQK